MPTPYEIVDDQTLTVDQKLARLKDYTGPEADAAERMLVRMKGMEEHSTRMEQLRQTMPNVQVVGKRADGAYLITTDGKQGQVFDPSSHKLYPPMLLDSLVARGYWTKPDNVDPYQLLASARPEEGDSQA